MSDLKPCEEEWRPIPGYPNYEASNLGNIRSWWKKNRSERADEPRVMRSSFCRLHGKMNYRQVSLRKNKRSEHYNIHVLIALTFHGPRPPGLQVAHLNGVASDNRVENLAYCTPKENTGHKRIHGTMSTPAMRGEGRGNAVLTNDAIRAIFREYRQGASKIGLAREFNISEKCIHDILKRKAWWCVEIPNLDTLEKDRAENLKGCSSCQYKLRALSALDARDGKGE